MSEKIKIGFVGTGWMGEQLLIKTNNHPDTEIKAVFDRNEEHAKEVMQNNNINTSVYVSSYDDIINNDDIDAVVLVSPNAFHAPQAIKALEKGKHVYSEKPNSTTFKDHLKLIELAEKNPHLVTMTDYIFNFDHMGLKIKEMINNDKFGKIIQAQINYRHAVNIQGNKAWKLKKEIIGDAIGMGITHSVFMLIHLLSTAKPVSVYATSHPSTTNMFEVEPIWNIMIKFDNDATGFVFGDIENGTSYDAYHNLYGTKGGFVFDSQSRFETMVKYWTQETNKEWVFPLDHENEKQKDFLWPKDISMPNSGDVIEHSTKECIDSFIDSIKNKKNNYLSFDNMRIIQDINFASQLSSKIGKPVELPADIEDLKKYLKD